VPFMMSKNVVETERPQMAIWRRVACWISKVTRAQTRQRRASTRAHARTHTHTQKYVILIAFPRQQWFHERASILRYTYIASLLQINSTT
jgi:hypothetical protein